MKNLPSKLIIGVLVIAVLAALAFVPSLINRQSATPNLYGKAIIGDVDDPASIVHFIVQGDKIFVDENKDDVPQPEELNSEKRLAEIADTKAGIKYDVHEFRLVVAPDAVSEKLPQQLGMTADIQGEFSYQQLGVMVLSADPQDAGVVQFNGPISLILPEPDFEFPKSGSEIPVRLLAGTVSSTTTKPHDSNLEKESQTDNEPPPFSLRRISFVVPEPEKAAPMLKIEFPTNDQPVIEEFRLDTMC